MTAPKRIVCLTTETTETLYLLGEEQRIVGISGYTMRPARARREKPKISAFTSAKIDQVLALEPDLVLGFSDLQADIAASLIRAGIAVHVFNHRTVAGILDMIRMLGAMVGAVAKAESLLAELQAGLAAIGENAKRIPIRPRVFFEEWHDPLISAIGWVSELITLAGGEDCFAELGRHRSARARIIADQADVVARAPDIIIGSWCGKRFQPDLVCARPGWEMIPAVQTGALHEIKSANILQPGPGALTDGVGQLHKIFVHWAAGRS